MREFATVEEVTEDHFVVKTTRDELYWIDASFNDGFETGGLVLVAYEPEAKVPDGEHFLVSPSSVEQSSTHPVVTYVD